MVGLPPCLFIGVSHHRPRLIIWIVAYIFLHSYFDRIPHEHQQRAATVIQRDHVPGVCSVCKILWLVGLSYRRIDDHSMSGDQ